MPAFPRTRGLSMKRALILASVLLTAPAFARPVAPCTDDTADTTIPPISLQQVARGFHSPTFVTNAGDRRLFVVEQRGVIRIVTDDTVQHKPFLDIRDRVAAGGERGLLSVAFDPHYKENGFFYVDYTSRRGGRPHTVVSRFHRASSGRADRHSEKILLSIPQPFANHNGGQLAFGPDGYLYVGTGDGGGANDPHGNAQNLSSLLGKLLRIDVDHAGDGRPYAIPQNNPFVRTPGARPEIWAYGLRNPWRFSFDALNGRLFLGDVGQDAVEEVDIIERGGNYGWNVMEGNICTPGVNPHCKPEAMLPPLYTYTHATGRSITSGYVYRGNTVPGLCGTYIYGDYVSHRIWGLRYNGEKIVAQRELLDTDLAISSFGQGADYELYVVDHAHGRIMRILPLIR